MMELPEDQKQYLSPWKAHKIKDPKQYGGWSQGMRFWAIFAPIGLVIGIIGMTKDNEVKKAQAMSLIITSIFFGVLGSLYMIVSGI